MLTKTVLALFVMGSLLSIGCAPGAELEEEELAGTSNGLRSPDNKGFSFGRDSQEKKNAVPITKGGNEWRVIFSVPLDDLRADERLAVRGEVTLSKCVPSEGAPCNRDTPFDPKFTAKIVLASSANDTNGPALSGSPSTTCNRREHHCTLVIDEAIKGAAAGKKKFANLIVAAEGNGATPQDIMKVESQHGGLYVTRIAPGADATGSVVSLKEVSGGSMKIDNVDDNNGAGRRDAHVIFREKVDVQPGDILSVDGTVVAKIDDGSCDPLIMNQVFVSKDGSGDPEKSKLVELTAQNGTNCLDSECTYEKSGAGEIPSNAPKTVWVSVVAKAGRSCAASGDRWSIGAGSRVNVRVRR